MSDDGLSPAVGPLSVPDPAPSDSSSEAVERVRLSLDPRLPTMAGQHGGTLYRGGVPRELRANGGKLGRKVRDGKAFAEKMRRLADSSATTRAIRSILCDPDHDQFGRVLEFVAERGYGRVPQRVEAEHNHRHAVVLLPAMDPLASSSVTGPVSVVEPALSAPQPSGLIGTEALQPTIAPESPALLPAVSPTPETATGPTATVGTDGQPTAYLGDGSLSHTGGAVEPRASSGEAVEAGEGTPDAGLALAVPIRPDGSV